MSTFRIHEDQENRGNFDLRQKHANMAPMPKRSVLGVLQSQADHTKQPTKSKQPLELSLAHTSKDNVFAKPAPQKSSPPVPVAQFKAFKVYEDSKENNVPGCHHPAKDISKGAEKLISNIPKKGEWFVQGAIPKSDKNKDKLQNEDKENVQVKQEESKVVKAPSPAKIIPKSLKEESPMSTESTDKIVLMVRGEEVLLDEVYFELLEYRPDIYTYLRELELKSRPRIAYMRKQPDITYNMRTILIDWLVEVAQEYKLHSETLFLAVNYIDRFLSYMSVLRGKLQLVGTAAMFIAAKYEEIYPPEVSEFVYITDDTYTKKQVLRMEHLILKVLSFDLSVPTPLTFITATAISCSIPDKVSCLAMYLSELMLMEADAYIETLPSVLAASAIGVARYILKVDPWSPELKRSTGYDVKDLRKTMELLYLLFCKAPTQTQQAIREKFGGKKYLHVSNLPPRDDV